MPKLSPTAQAVVDSMYRSYDHEPTRCLVAAAVLRTAAKYYGYSSGPEETAELMGRIVDVDDLIRLATELENYASTENHG